MLELSRLSDQEIKFKVNEMTAKVFTLYITYPAKILYLATLDFEQRHIFLGKVSQFITDHKWMHL